MNNYKGIKAIVFTMVFFICHMFKNNFILKIHYKMDYKVRVFYDISIVLICMTKYEGISLAIWAKGIFFIVGGIYEFF